MNSRGILFTGIVFLIVLSIISLNTVIRENRSYEQQFVVPAKILAVSALHENIIESVTELKKSEAASEIEQRITPFDYSFGEKTLDLEFRLPFRNWEFELYFDTLNVSEIMLEDKNYDHIFTGLQVDVNTVKNAEWGGTADKFGFLLDEFCYQLSVENEKVSFAESKSGKCVQSFDFSKIERMDINVTVLYFDEDLNSIECSPAPCLQQAFNPAETNPFFSLDVNDELCGNCNFSNKQVSMHYDPDTTQTITISCAPSCNESSDITITLGKGIEISNSGSRVGVNLGHSFTEEFHSFRLLDFNVAVSTPDSKIIRSNNPNSVS